MLLVQLKPLALLNFHSEAVNCVAQSERLNIAQGVLIAAGSKVLALVKYV